MQAETTGQLVATQDWDFVPDENDIDPATREPRVISGLSSLWITLGDMEPMRMAVPRNDGHQPLVIGAYYNITVRLLRRQDDNRRRIARVELVDWKRTKAPELPAA